jgi:DNA-binding NtrC family response regulator
LLIVDDDAPFRGVMASELKQLGFAVVTAESGNEALLRIDEAAFDVVLLDLQLPDMNGIEVLKAIRGKSPASEVIMLTGHGCIDTAIESIRIGAFDYVSKPCPLDELEIRIQRALERQALRRRAMLLERGLTPADPGSSLVGSSPEFRRAVELAERVAPSNSTVLITGETGSGKEMIARLLHARSPRREHPFVVVECAALQEDLLQSELFGHERGAFTGADRAKPGLFEVADEGTVFLDEIGEVSQRTQLKLLRVLDTSTFRHLGGTKEISVDMRVLAATNRDLEAMVRQGLFRQDLYYRLGTITVALPALRHRRPDIELLVKHFVELLNARFGVTRRMGNEALDRLRRHDWPGNVRELLHVVEHAMLVCDGNEIRLEHLPASLREAPLATAASEGGDAVGDLPSLAELERAHIERVLRSVDYHRSRAARILGISERNLYRKIREYGLLD